MVYGKKCLLLIGREDLPSIKGNQANHPILLVMWHFRHAVKWFYEILEILVMFSGGYSCNCEMNGLPNHADTEPTPLFALLCIAVLFYENPVTVVLASHSSTQ